jgi:hypothetical protein
VETGQTSTLTRLLDRAKADPDVLAVILFGSQARGEATPRSDIDVCLVLAPDSAAEPGRTEKQLDYLGRFDLDVSVFQQLPLAVRSRVLKEGRILFARDEPALYALAVRTARAWERFRPIHRMYLEQVAGD